MATTRRNSSQSAMTKTLKKNKYRVVFESVTQEKKKLRSVVSYSVAAPPGFTHVPVGIRDLSDYCKELSRKEGLSVHVVTAVPVGRSNLSSLSQHINRVGYHFRNDVVERACNILGYSNRGRRYMRDLTEAYTHPPRLHALLAAHGRRLGIDEANVSKGQRENQIREAMQELFPKIPTPDVNKIVSNAFKEGASKVGTAKDLTLPRRVQLAVIAHIRHTYTVYDQLLRMTTWEDARRQCERPILDKLVQWRGEDNTGVDELEDIFREVIVLDDEDDDTASGEDNKGDDRDSSVEVISTVRLAADVEPEEIYPDDRMPQYTSYRVQEPEYRRPTIVHVQPRRLARLPAAGLDRSEMTRRWDEAMARNAGLLCPAAGVVDLTLDVPEPDHELHPTGVVHDTRLHTLQPAPFQALDGTRLFFAEADDSRHNPRQPAFAAPDGSQFFDVTPSSETTDHDHRQPLFAGVDGTRFFDTADERPVRFFTPSEHARNLYREVYDMPLDITRHVPVEQIEAPYNPTRRDMDNPPLRIADRGKKRKSMPHFINGGSGTHESYYIEQVEKLENSSKRRRLQEEALAQNHVQAKRPVHHPLRTAHSMDDYVDLTNSSPAARAGVRIPGLSLYNAAQY